MSDDGFLWILMFFLLIWPALFMSGDGAVDSEVNATAEVVGTEWHEDSVVATVNVTNTDTTNGTVGLHVHYWEGACNKDDGHLIHTHKPSTHTEAGETTQITDTMSSEPPEDVDCVSAHVHE